MNRAIITGAAGFVGSCLARRLLRHGIPVLALGRKPWEQVDAKRLQESEDLTYVQVDLSDIQSLPERAKEAGWVSSDGSVFYHFAWGGVSRLSDLDIDAQMQNVARSVNAMRAARKLGCTKFVHVGTMEEAFTSKYLELDFHSNSEYNRHVIYSVAKTAARRMLKLVALEEQINLVVAFNSHVMGPNDDKDSFLQVTLKKLIDGSELIFSTGEQMFDVIPVGECARAYHLIGECGKNFREYWIGSGQARRLRDYVEIMAGLYPSGQELQFGKMPYNDISLTKEDFRIDLLTQDTGFIPAQTYEDAVHELYRWLTEGACE